MSVSMVCLVSLHRKKPDSCGPFELVFATFGEAKILDLNS